MEFLRVICSAERRLVYVVHLAGERQAGIGPISQKPELVTMGLSDALYRTSFRQGRREVDYFFGHLHMVVSGHPFAGSVPCF
jgi:hypothetical protein